MLAVVLFVAFIYTFSWFVVEAEDRQKERNLRHMTIRQLKRVAQTRHLKGYSRLSKVQLLEALIALECR